MLETIQLETKCPRCDTQLEAVINLPWLLCRECGYQTRSAPELTRRAGERITRDELNRLRPHQK